MNLDYQNDPTIIETREQLGSLRQLNIEEFKNYFPNALGLWDCFFSNVRFAANEITNLTKRNKIRELEAKKCKDSYAKNNANKNFNLQWSIYDGEKQKFSNNDVSFFLNNF